MPQEKIVGYLLSDTHPEGRHKAAFFTAFGFSIERREEFARALLRHLRENEALEEARSPFGRRYLVEGIIHAPDGRTPMIRSIWFIERGAEAPRLVTAFPGPRRG